MFRSFAEQLAETSVSQLFQNQPWIVPTSQSIHILSVCMVFTSAVMINLRLLGIWGASRTVLQLTRELVPWMWGGLVMLLLTGTVQTIAEPVREFVTPVFWAKMAMIAIVSLMTAVFARKVHARAASWDVTSAPSAGARSFAVSTSILWIAIIVCGRFVGYTWSFYV